VKKYILGLFALFIFSGCNNNNLDIADEKIALIEKAANTDILAMITLNKNFFINGTEEGLSFNNKWYELVLNNKNADLILEYSESYSKYSPFILNGKEKFNALIARASELGNQNAHIPLLRTDYNKNGAIEKRILSGDNEKSLTKLLEYYNFNKRKEGFPEKAEQVTILLNNLKKQTTNPSFEKLVTLFHKQKSDWRNEKLERQYDAHLKQIIASEDEKTILKSVNFLKDNNNRFDILSPFYKRLIELDNHNIEYKKLLLTSYNSLYDYDQEKYEKDIITLLKTVSFTDDYDATLQLLKIYTKDYSIADQYSNDLEDGTLNKQEPIVVYVNEPNFFEKILMKLFKKEYIPPKTRDRTDDLYPQEYPEFVKKISTMNNAKRALGVFYFWNREYNKSLDILEDSASSGDKEAIYYLSTKLNSHNEDFAKASYRWANVILNSENPILISKLKSKIYNFNTENAQKIKEKINAIYTTNKSFIRVSTLIKQYNALSFSERKSYLKKQIVDKKNIDFYHLFSKSRLFSKNSQEVEDALSSYKFLADKGHLTSITTLASFYKKPHTPSKHLKNLDLSVFYYKKAISLGQISAIRELFCLYKCPNMGRTPQEKDEEDIKKYVDIIIKNKQGGEIINDLGLIYCCYKKPNDFQKSIYYFLKSAEAGYAKGFYSAAKVYKNNLNDEVNYLKYAKASAHQGNSEAAYELGNYFADKKQNTKALNFYKISYKNKGFNAGIRLGYYYEQGKLGLKKDVEKALQYYLNSYYIRRTDEAAMNIGLIYHFGKGSVKQDLALAKKWYSRSKLQQAKNNLRIITGEKG